MTGHALTDVQAGLQDMPAGGTDTSTREVSLRELTLARALYRCGDYEGLGERILREYSRDLRGHYARHAAAVLRERILREYARDLRGHYARHAAAVLRERGGEKQDKL